MVSITLSVPEEMKKEMESFPEINWSEIARWAIKERLVMMDEFRKFTKDSKFTEKDAISLGNKVSLSALKRHKK